MGIRFHKRVLSRIAATTAALTLALGVALPLLDISAGVGTAFEADHEYGCFIATHDHSICNQFGNKRLSSDGTRPELFGPRLVDFELPELSEILLVVSVDTQVNPRAPPPLIVS